MEMRGIMRMLMMVFRRVMRIVNRLLTSVNSHVGLQASSLTEFLLTDMTLVWLLISVYAAM